MSPPHGRPPIPALRKLIVTLDFRLQSCYVNKSYNFYTKQFYYYKQNPFSVVLQSLSSENLHHNTNILRQPLSFVKNTAIIGEIVLSKNGCKFGTCIMLD